MHEQEFSLGSGAMFTGGGRAASVNLTNLRGKSVEDAIGIAREEPHLLKGGEGTEGLYVGAPQNIKSYDDLLAQRAKMDANLLGRSEYADALERMGHNPSNASAEDVRAALWYERAKTENAALSQNPASREQQIWNAKIDAEFSPGTDPGPEFNAALGARNSAIANKINPVYNADGTPKIFTDRIDRVPPPGSPQELQGVRQTARPLQSQHMARAIVANDPSILATGKKTGEYAKHMTEGEVQPGATGVGDFRWFNELGFTNPDGSRQSAGSHLTGKTNHTWADYETALATDRARIGHNGGPPLHGRSDWTGEQVQALGWVRQKAQDLQNAGGYKMVNTPWGLHQEHKMSWDEAMRRANMTPFDSADRQTFNAIHENMPGLSGHLPNLSKQPQSVQDAYSTATTWRDANNKDMLYGALHPQEAPDVRVLMQETVPAQGVWKGDDGVIQYNRADVARPLVSFKTGGGGVAEPDVRMIRAAEGTRGLVDAQAMSGGHMVIPESQVAAGEMGSFRIPMDRALTKDEAQALTTIGEKYGRPHISDTGSGVSMTNWFDAPSGVEAGRILRKSTLPGELADALEGSGAPYRAKLESHMFEFPPSEVGSGARSKAVLDEISQSPALYRALNYSTEIPQKALANLQRDKEYLKQNPDAFRKDQLELLRIISEGPGWLDRVSAAVTKGGIVPVALLAAFAGAERPQ